MDDRLETEWVFCGNNIMAPLPSEGVYEKGLYIVTVHDQRTWESHFIFIEWLVYTVVSLG